MAARMCATNLSGRPSRYSAIGLEPSRVEEALWQTCEAAAEHDRWVIAGSLRKTKARMLNLMHVIAPSGEIAHESAKVHMAGRE
jgi:predicted amidohydrolase